VTQTSGSSSTETERPLFVVLGASGFIGSAVVGALAGRSCRIRAVSRRPAPPPPDGVAGYDAVQADLTDPAQLAASIAGADAVIHLLLGDGGWRAAETDPAAGRVNVGVMSDLINLLHVPAGPPPALLYAGTTAQAGPHPGRALDGTEPDRPETRYDQQKLDAENLLKAATHAGAVRGVSLRLPTVFGHGPVPDRGVVAAMVRRALAGEDLTVWGAGSVTRDLVYLPDVAAAFLAALDHADALAGRHWLVGSGHSRTLAEIFGAVSETVAERTGRAPVPVISVDPPAHATASDAHGVTIDDSAFRSATGWRPRVPFRTALDETVRALLHEPSARAATT